MIWFKQPETISGPRCIRMTIEYVDHTLTLLRSMRLEKVAPRSVPPCGPEGEAGFWYELQDVSGRTLFRRLLPAAIAKHAEFVRPDGTIEHVSLPTVTGTFSLLAPDLEEADALVVFDSPLDDHTAAAREIARFSLSPQAVH